MPSSAPAPRVGVLSLQGDFACHRGSLETLGVDVRRVTLPRDLDGVEALVLPGGESTTMLRLLEATGLRAPLEAFVRERPVFGTCAGVILLGRGATGLPAAPLGALDVTVERNAYGRQLDSTVLRLTDTAKEELGPEPLEAVFIRAPKITRAGRGVEVLARRNSPREAETAYRVGDLEPLFAQVQARPHQVAALRLQSGDEAVKRRLHMHRGETPASRDSLERLRLKADELTGLVEVLERWVGLRGDACAHLPGLEESSWRGDGLRAR